MKLADWFTAWFGGGALVAFQLHSDVYAGTLAGLAVSGLAGAWLVRRGKRRAAR